MNKGILLSAVVAGLIAGKAMADHHEGKKCEKGDAKCEAEHKKGDKSACSGKNGCDGKNSCKGEKADKNSCKGKKADKNSCKGKKEEKHEEPKH